MIKNYFTTCSLNSVKILIALFLIFSWEKGRSTTGINYFGFQGFPVEGKILDSEGMPLPGANILEKGTSNGVQSDFDGNFSLNVSGEDAVLLVSYVGFAQQEVSVGGRSTIEITLEEDAAALSEVVVVGYGTQRKRDVTGAISSISDEDINITKESNPINALSGKVAGLDVGVSSSPGSSPSVLVRGRSSLNFSNEPLLVVDGIPIEGDLNDINSSDIASIEVLKDASSAAIYGARGANGVILVTTKRGKLGKATITYETYYGNSKVVNNFDLLNADEYVRLRQEATRAGAEEEQGLLPGSLSIPAVEDVLTPLQLAAYRDGVNTDFLDLGTRVGNQLNHSFGISGGSERIRYNVSLNYFSQEGVFNLADYERISSRVNLDINATDKIKIGLSQQANYGKANNYNPLLDLIRQPPLVRPFNADGTPTLDPLADGLVWNPLSNEAPGNYINETINYNYFANFFGSYRFSDDLKYTLNVQPQFEAITDNDFRASQSDSQTGGLSQASKEQRIITAYTIENIVNYSTAFKDIHTLDATLLYSFQKTKRDFLQLSVLGPAADSQTFNNLGDASQIDARDSSLETESWVSYMARFNYGFKDRYLLTLTGRYDGSSKLSQDHKYGFFPSASVAWRVIEEGFMKKQHLFGDLKVRAGYGEVGRNPIAPYSTFGGIARVENSFGNNPAFGFRPQDIANPDLKWETTKTFNAGIDFAVLDNRISGSVDYYRGRTEDLLLNRVLPSTSGFNSILQNVGITENEGFEVVLSTLNIKSENFTWSTDFNFSRNRNEIVKLLDSENDDVGNGWFIGQPLSVYYDRVFSGIWQIDEAEVANSYGRRPGDIKLADINNDRVLNDSDRRILGQQDPKWIGGLTSRMTYKGFDFTVSAYTHQDFLVNAEPIDITTLFGRFNDLDLDYWTPENPTNAFPRPNENRERPLDNATLNYRDGSFVRIRNITLGYNLEKEVTDVLGIQKLRLYASAQNAFLFTATDIEGFDPELGVGDDFISAPRTLMLGLDVTF
ncbi:SusC/RagA family TonB-linked outer membrane protein [Flavimarina sp. Hel_I_48]|uniref:SusC/RagA family TonB-linked outer membrane protein n=1 Tax=Flavimarina sp. Hel_I_48 TaxID=1392488 RepID=UPI00069106FE|nr:TonB-dependent receptor [Flavimarina sp. Hel_I_48]